MDYVTRQFIVLAKKLRDDVRKSLGDIHADMSRLISTLSQKQADTPCTHSKTDDKKYWDEPRVIRAELSTPVAISVKNEAQDRHPNWQRVKTVVEIVGILAAIFYAYMAVRQWREMISARHLMEKSANDAVLNREQSKIALDATVRQFHLEQRAWLAITPGAPVIPKLEIGKMGPGGGVVKTSIRIENTGRTPAQMLKGKMRLEIILADAPKLAQHYKPPSFDYSAQLRKENLKIVDTPLLPPNAGVTISLRDSISVSDMFDYWPYKTVIYGELRYCDVFNEQHRVNFCFEYRGADESTPGDLSQYTACVNTPPDKNSMDDTGLHEKCKR